MAASTWREEECGAPRMLEGQRGWGREWFGVRGEQTVGRLMSGGGRGAGGGTQPLALQRVEARGGCVCWMGVSVQVCLGLERVCLLVVVN